MRERNALVYNRHDFVVLHYRTADLRARQSGDLRCAARNLQLARLCIAFTAFESVLSCGLRRPRPTLGCFPCPPLTNYEEMATLCLRSDDCRTIGADLPAHRLRETCRIKCMPVADDCLTSSTLIHCLQANNPGWQVTDGRRDARVREV